MRVRRILIPATALALALAAASSAQPASAPAARAPVSETGTADGAPYRIDVPANWNRGLVVLFHGYEGDDPRRRRPDPWPAEHGTEAFLGRGYAVIQSGYSRRGWAVAEARGETRRLRALFERRFGPPRRAYVTGFSMGGHLALATVEQEPDRYDGALALCPAALSATELFDRAATELAAAHALFPETIPDVGAPAALPFFDPAAFGRALAANPDAAAQLSALTGFRPRDVPSALFLFYVATREIGARAGGFPGTNARVRYAGFGDDAAFNRRVRRYTASPAARRYVAANATLTGRIADPVVILANVYDDIISGQTTTIYPARVRAAGRSDWLTVLPPAGVGHCRFTPEQIGAGFDRLLRAADRRRRR